jgi:hypothetical protein
MKSSLVGILVAAAAALSIPASASGAEYYFDVSCGLTEASPASHVCETDDQIGAFFEADEETEYEVCVEFPNAAFICLEEQLAEANVLYVNQIFTNQLGEHLASWWIGDELIGLWDFQVVSPPLPPPPAPPAPAPAPAPAPSPPAVTPQVSAACVKARREVSRVRALLRRPQLRRASARKRKARLRGRLRRANAAVRRVC